MATATIILPISGAGFPASNPAGLAFENARPQLLYDDTTDESAQWVFRMPENYASGLTLKMLYKMASATAAEVIFDGSIMANADGEQTNTDSFDAVNSSGAITVPGTAGFQDSISVALANADSVAAGEMCAFKLSRDADNASDDATGDAEVFAVSLEYTTS